MNKVLPIIFLSLLLTISNALAGDEEDMRFLNAAKIADLPSIQKAIEDGANVNFQNSSGDSALFFICCPETEINGWEEFLKDRQRRIEVLNYLVTVPGINLNIRNPILGYTVLHYMDDDFLEAAKILVSHGADINISEEHNRTPLLSAVGWYQPEKIRFFVTVPGINLNAVDETGESALSKAKRLGYQDIQATLEEAGAKD